MDSDIKKEGLSSQELPAEGQKELDSCDECDCDYCYFLKSSKPKLTFATNKNHRFYYQTPSRKTSHS